MDRDGGPAERIAKSVDPATPEVQAASADRFRAMHRAGQLLVLPNAWDALSGRLYELAGFRAIATTSSGISASLGHPDGESIGVVRMSERLRDICQAVAIPVTADVVGGFGSSPAQVRASVRTFVAQGIVGINLEDRGDRDASELRGTRAAQAAIVAARQAGEDLGVGLVINARTNVLLHSPVTKAAVTKAVNRATAFFEVGADCAFVPGPTRLETIAELAQRIPGPLNVLVTAVSPGLALIEKAGVARVSFGSWPMRAAYSLVQEFAIGLRKSGTLEALARSALSHRDLQEFYTANRGQERPERERQRGPAAGLT
jgi:2-methylisocitrate lyase-like PEP mutase family enzyme